ncbi:hypothetical protein Tco_0334990 [Tanacetum coccineum]
MSSRTLPVSRNLPSLIKSLESLCSSSGTPLRKSQAQTPKFYLANKKCLVDAEVFRKILDICPKFQGEYFNEVPDDETTFTFLINLGYKGPLYKHLSMHVDQMHQPWKTLAAIINKCLSGKSASNDMLRKSRIDILCGMFCEENVNYPELIWEDFAFQINNKELKNGRREIMPYPRFTEIIINHFLSKHQSLAKLKNLHTHTIKDDGVVNRLKFVRIAARQVHATHERIVTKFDPEPARRRPSGIAFTDTSSVSKNMSPDPSQKLKGTGRIPRVPDESTGILSTSSEGAGTKPGVLDEEKDTFAVKANVTLDLGSEEESEYTKEDDDDENIEWVDTDEEEDKNDDDDDKSIDLQRTDDEETDNEFVHSEEHVQDDDEETDDEFVHGDKQVNDNEDEEMTNVTPPKLGRSRIRVRGRYFIIQQHKIQENDL